MARVIAIISCLAAALFLVPIQGDCCEMPEYESETEIECCVVANSLFQSQVVENQPKLLRASNIVRPHEYISVRIQKLDVHLPARILNCVFRE